VTPLVLVVSEEIYWSIVRHGYEGIPESGFGPLVRVVVAGRRHRGWVHVPVPGLTAEQAAALAGQQNPMIAA
jgi:hypothetical protein